MVRVTCADVAVAELRESEWFRRVLAVWDRWRGAQFAPRWRIPDMIELPSRVLSYLTVVDVRPEPEDFIYRYWGGGHRLVYGVELTGRSVAKHVPPALRETFVEQYRRVVADRQPLGFRHQLCGDDGTLQQQTLRLPLSDDGETVTQVLSYVDWGRRDKEWRQVLRDGR